MTTLSLPFSLMSILIVLILIAGIPAMSAASQVQSSRLNQIDTIKPISIAPMNTTSPVPERTINIEENPSTELSDHTINQVTRIISPQVDESIIAGPYDWDPNLEYLPNESEKNNIDLRVKFLIAPPKQNPEPQNPETQETKPRFIVNPDTVELGKTYAYLVRLTNSGSDSSVPTEITFSYTPDEEPQQSGEGTYWGFERIFLINQQIEAVPGNKESDIECSVPFPDDISPGTGMITVEVNSDINGPSVNGEYNYDSLPITIQAPSDGNSTTGSVKNLSKVQNISHTVRPTITLQSGFFFA